MYMDEVECYCDRVLWVCGVLCGWCIVAVDVECGQVR